MQAIPEYGVFCGSLAAYLRGWLSCTGQLQVLDKDEQLTEIADPQWEGQRVRPC